MNSQPANCSPQQSSETCTHPIEEDMDCQIGTTKCPSATAGESSEAKLPNGLTAEPEELELTINYSIQLGMEKKFANINMSLQSLESKERTTSL